MQAAPGASLSSSDPDHHRGGPSRAIAARRAALRIFLLVALTGYAVDLATKTLALQRLDGRPPVRVVGDLLQLTLAFNPGAAFSTGTSYTEVLSVIAIAAAAAVLWFARRLGSRVWGLALGLLLAGVLGNLTDRIFRPPGVLRGHVVDFLALPNWPIFNVADMCINVAAGLIVLQAFRGVSIDGKRPTTTGADETDGIR